MVLKTGVQRVDVKRLGCKSKTAVGINRSELKGWVG